MGIPEFQLFLGGPEKIFSGPSKKVLTPGFIFYRVVWGQSAGAFFSPLNPDSGVEGNLFIHGLI
jgi:hypothetical protein